VRSRIVHNGSVEIYTESFGSSVNPTVLLIMGATAQRVMWPDSFCYALSSLGFFVIRYDNRDTGKSSHVDYVNNPYYLEDLGADALAILNDYGIESAHWVCVSMGGQIGQLNAIYNPNRVKTLTCIMSTPNHLVFVDGFEGRDVSQHGLPASNPKILRYYQAILGLKPSSKDEAAKMYKSVLQEIMKTPEHMVEIRVFEGHILKRLKGINHIHNHSLAMAGSKDLHERLNMIKVPTLVIHGKEDSILPVEHGKKLAELINGAEFVEYENMGHCFSDEIFDKLFLDLSKFLKQHEVGKLEQVEQS
jgi:pimeloyl-ACP methyl ester carboxylesterase